MKTRISFYINKTGKAKRDSFIKIWSTTSENDYLFLSYEDMQELKSILDNTMLDIEMEEEKHG
jgi:hypothetical protein